MANSYSDLANEYYDKFEYYDSKNFSTEVKKEMQQYSVAAQIEFIKRLIFRMKKDGRKDVYLFTLITLVESLEEKYKNMLKGSVIGK